MDRDICAHETKEKKNEKSENKNLCFRKFREKDFNENRQNVSKITDLWDLFGIAMILGNWRTEIASNWPTSDRVSNKFAKPYHEIDLEWTFV